MRTKFKENESNTEGKFLKEVAEVKNITKFYFYRFISSCIKDKLSGIFHDWTRLLPEKRIQTYEFKSVSAIKKTPCVGVFLQYR